MGGNQIALLVWILRAWPSAHAYFDITQQEENTFIQDESPQGFMNRTQILELVTHEKYDGDSAVQTFIAAYNFNKLDSCKKHFPTGVKRSTFIVIEGQEGTNKFGLAKRLAKVLQGNLVYNPPKGYTPFRNALHDPKLVTAFFSLCHYITAQQVRKYAVKRPVVVSGYYIGQKVFSIAKNFFPRTPPVNSSVWAWPNDLLIPDLVFNLVNPVDSDQHAKGRSFINYTQAITNAWPSPKVIPVYNVSSYEDMIEEILPRVFTMVE